MSTSDMDYISLRKEHSKKQQIARSKLSNKRCLFCNSKEKLCNSHTIPSFILHSVFTDGHVYNTKSFDFALTTLEKNESGIKNTNIFNMICRNCDSKFFGTTKMSINF